MTKNSKVTNVQANGTWEGQYGLMYKFDVTFENGDSGEYSSKSQEQNKFVVGQNADYNFIDGKYPKVKPVSNYDQNSYKPTTQANNNRETFIIRQSTLKCATDYVIANGGNTKTIIDNAEIMTKWVLTGNTPAGVPESKDLPF